MLIGLTPARTDFFTGFMLKKNSKKLLYLFLNLVFPKKVFEVTLFYGTGMQFVGALTCGVWRRRGVKVSISRICADSFMSY